MKLFSRRSLLVAAILAFPLLFAVFGLLIYPAWIFSGHGFDLAGFEQVRPGMTMAEVENLMGKPSIKESLDGTPVWTYNKYQKWCIGHIFFDRDGKVKEKEHDH